MIINFSVQNFGTIKDKLTLSFEADKSTDLEEYYIIEPLPGLRLLKLALIYGANASGKTTILQAFNFLIDLALEPLEKKTESLKFQPFLFDEETPKQNTSFILEFIQNKIRYYYEIEFNQEAIVEEKLYYFNPKKALVYERKTDIEKQLTSIKFGGKINIKKEAISFLEANTLWNNTVLGGFIKTNFESKELQAILYWFKEVCNPIIKPNTRLYGFILSKIGINEINKNIVLKLVQKADLMINDIVVKTEYKDVDDKFIDFLAKTSIPSDELTEIKKTKKLEQKTLFFQHEVKKGGQTKNYLLEFDNESTGTKRYYEFSGLLDLLIRKQYIFSIDEIESSLHPDLLEHFLLTFLVNAKNSQIIATTHYREFLMKRDMFRNDAIWLTEKQPDGGVDLYSLADFDTSVIRDTSSVYNAYKIGKLGAVPNLGDYYIDLEDDGKTE